MSFFEEVYGQPDSIRAAVHHFADVMAPVSRFTVRVKYGSLHRVVFTGMGASYTAAYPAVIYLRSVGVNAMLIETSELVHYQMPILDERTLVVAISQSGQSVEIARLIEALEGRSPLIAVTNDALSPLASHSATAVLLHAGDEHTVSTKTYTATLAVLHILTRFLFGDPLDDDIAELDHLAQEIETRLPQWHEQARAIAGWLAECPFLTFLGRGPSQASAMTSALIVKESAKLGTEGLNSGQFRHGPIEIVDERFGGVLFAGTDEPREINLGLANQITGLGGRLAIIDSQSDSSAEPHPTRALENRRIQIPKALPWLLPLVEIIPIQLLAGELANARGIEPGSFRYIKKVTRHE